MLAEAKCFAIHCGADLEIVHAAAFDMEKEKRFVAALGRRVSIRWVAGETAAQAIIAAVKDFAYNLLIAGPLTAKRTTNRLPATLRRSCCAMRPAISSGAAA